MMAYEFWMYAVFLLGFGTAIFISLLYKQMIEQDIAKRRIQLLQSYSDNFKIQYMRFLSELDDWKNKGQYK